MGEILLLYLFTRLDALIALGTVTAIIVGVVGGFGALGSAAYIKDYMREENEPQAWQTWRKYTSRAFIVFALGVLVTTLVPSKTDMAIILGGKIALDASRTDTAKEIGQEVMDAIRAQLKQAAK